MKLKILPIFYLIVLVMSFYSVSAADLSIELLSYDPYPVVSGESFDVEFEVENLLDLNINVTLKVYAKDPFFLISSSEQELFLNPGESEIVDYIIYVEGDAEEGEHELKLKYKVNDGDWKTEEFDIKVKERESFLSIVSVSSIPEEIKPGETAEIKIRLRNDANSLIKDIIVRLDISAEEIPFAPLGSVTEKRIEKIEEGQEKEIAFDIITLSDAELKIYKIPLIINYYDEYGTEYSKEDIVSLVVWSPPNLGAKVEESNLVLGQPSIVKIDFLNKGLSDIKFLSVKTYGSGFDILDSDTEYIGSIESDDYETLELRILPKNQNIVMSLTLEYKDENNKPYLEQINLYPKVYTLEEAQKLGIIKAGSKVGIFITIVIIVVIVFWIWRKRKRRKQLV